MTDRLYNVAIVGATGAVGETLLSILEQRKFPVGTLQLLASAKSAGAEMSYGGRKHFVKDLASADFAGVDIAFFSAGGPVSAEYAPRAAVAGAAVIDNTSHFRNDPDVPLVISEVNPEALAGWRARGIIANPNCSTMQMLVALAPIHRVAGIRRINVATYQSVSGAGRSAMQELGEQTAAMLSFKAVEPKRFPVQIAFNVIPHIDNFEANGYTREEMKMAWETQKIFGDPSIGVNATAVRVPVFYGHAEALHIETRDWISVETVRELLRAAPGVEVVDLPEPGGYPTPVSHASGADAVFVGRIRQDISHAHGLSLWVVSDNIRKGAALNAIQLAELLVKSYL